MASIHQQRQNGQTGRAGRRRGPLPMADSDPMGQHDTALARPSHMQGGLRRMQEEGRGAGGSRHHTYKQVRRHLLGKGRHSPQPRAASVHQLASQTAPSWWLTRDAQQGQLPSSKDALTLPLTPGLTQSPFGISRGWSAQPGGALGLDENSGSSPGEQSPRTWTVQPLLCLVLD